MIMNWSDEAKPTVNGIIVPYNMTPLQRPQSLSDCLCKDKAKRDGFYNNNKIISQENQTAKDRATPAPRWQRRAGGGPPAALFDFKESMKYADAGKDLVTLINLNLGFRLIISTRYTL